MSDILVNEVLDEAAQYGAGETGTLIGQVREWIALGSLEGNCSLRNNRPPPKRRLWHAFRIATS
jgi:hypothetical protein